MWQHERQKRHAKAGRKETKTQQFMYRHKMNVQHEMHDYTSNNWSHRNSNKRFKEILGSHTRKHSTDSLLKTAVLGTSHIIRKVMQSET
jgi:hypothetical protein